MKPFDISDPSAFFQIQIQETLRSVLDPELNINIIDLGLVYDIQISEPGKLITVIMTLSSRYCPMGDAILQAVKNCLEHHYGAYHVQINLTWEPRWSYENISEEGLRQLGR